MKKLIVAITLVLLIIILMIGCSATNPPQQPPKLSITISEKQLEYVVGENKWNGSIYNREGTFQTILKKGSKNEIPYIEIGNTATISFTNNPPEKFTISDILIDENGNQRYSNKEIINIPVELKDGMGSFEIKKHLASGLSSYYVEGKTDIRGFRMIATWEENECEYAFIIRTDSF
ncbi:hypothetical protein LGK97_16605 [Clostridium sp. CS001]|uniref:hypothetical protein n=1 Tax=Clostridium sp. CS001 TaxID=2880648 RepID=UPI001CF552D8|nr:hypothetical protein [Clostridium sp. CS001]MCB2291349.1 hypothetical protein [Clostridium sp. CS001]